MGDETKHRIEYKRTYHIDQDVKVLAAPLLEQLGSIVRFPLLLLVLAEVAAECLLAPGAVDGVADGRKGRDGLVLAGVTEELTISVSFCHSLFFCFPRLSQEKECCEE